MSKTNWFLTKHGIFFSKGVMLAAACGTFSAYLGLHSLFLDRYRKAFQFYRCGFEKDLSEEMQSLTKEVLEESSLTEKQKASVKFFSACGFDMFHAGSTQLRTGGLVGLPNHFNYTETAEVEKQTIKLQNNTSVHWSTLAGCSLLDSLVLSRAAKKFAVAREIHYCTTSYVYAYSTLSTFSITIAYVLGSELALRYQMHKLPLKFRAAFYTFCGSIGLFVFLTTKDALSNYWDKYADKAASRTSLEYLDGGIEYYEKTLKRNVAIRTLMGGDAEKYFTWHGNIKTSFRTTTLPLTVRLDNLKAMKAREELTVDNKETS